jgi:hypothetical protein
LYCPWSHREDDSEHSEEHTCRALLFLEHDDMSIGNLSVGGNLDTKFFEVVDPRSYDVMSLRFGVDTTNASRHVEQALVGV